MLLTITLAIAEGQFFMQTPLTAIRLESQPMHIDVETQAMQPSGHDTQMFELLK